MVSNPPTEVGYSDDKDEVYLFLTIVGNSTVDELGPGSYKLTPGRARTLLSQLRSALPDEESEGGDA